MFLITPLCTYTYNFEFISALRLISVCSLDFHHPVDLEIVFILTENIGKNDGPSLVPTMTQL